MARNYKKNRAKARSPWETYNYWYDKYTKGDKKNLFGDKYTKKEFDKQYNLAKLAKMANPAKAVAQSQEYVDRSFEKNFNKYYGKKLQSIGEDLSDRKVRLELARKWVQEQGFDPDEKDNEGWKRFREYFY